MLPALAGLAAGASHALSGPDHLAAVLPLAAEGRGLRIGLSWAAGHGLGTIGLAILGLAVRTQLDLHRTELHAEALVGVVLVLTGLWTLLRVRSPHPRPQAGTAAGIGTLHGVAGGAHVVLVIGALAMPASEAFGWLFAFVVGAAVAMGGIGWVCQRIGGALPAAWHRRVRLAAGLGAVGVGAGWMAAALA
jgi:nickel/cobalt transporter (NicO) family protein